MSADASLVCGVDLGGRRARLCFLDPEDPRHPMMVRFEPPPNLYKELAYTEAAIWAGGMAPGVWAKMNPLVVWFEEPRGRSIKAVHQLSVMGGALLVGMPRKTSVEWVTAGEARKLVGLPGNARKEQIMEWANAEAELDFSPDQHDADALVMARAILAHGSRRTTPTTPPTEEAA